MPIKRRDRNKVTKIVVDIGGVNGGNEWDQSFFHRSNLSKMVCLQYDYVDRINQALHSGGKCEKTDVFLDQKKHFDHCGSWKNR